MGAVKALTELLTNAQTRFTEVIGEIKDLRKDINDRNKKKQYCIITFNHSLY